MHLRLLLLGQVRNAADPQVLSTVVTAPMAVIGTPDHTLNDLKNLEK
jgi:hypothetical protein